MHCLLITFPGFCSASQNAVIVRDFLSSEHTDHTDAFQGTQRAEPGAVPGEGQSAPRGVGADCCRSAPPACWAALPAAPPGAPCRCGLCIRYSALKALCPFLSASEKATREVGRGRGRAAHCLVTDGHY